MRIFLNEYKGLYIKVKEWLREEIAEDRKQLSANYIDDNWTRMRLVARTECAEDLLEQIEQWERNEDAP